MNYFINPASSSSAFFSSIQILLKKELFHHVGLTINFQLSCVKEHIKIFIDIKEQRIHYVQIQIQKNSHTLNT